MTATEYSQKAGRCPSLLSVYRKNRGMPKKTPSRDIYTSYMNELDEQNSIRNALQDMYYELKDRKSIQEFGNIVEQHGILTTKSFGIVLHRSFVNMYDRLLGVKYIDRGRKIVGLYEEWKCQISST